VQTPDDPSSNPDTPPTLDYARPVEQPPRHSYFRWVFWIAFIHLFPSCGLGFLSIHGGPDGFALILVQPMYLVMDYAGEFLFRGIPELVVIPVTIAIFYFYSLIWGMVIASIIFRLNRWPIPIVRSRSRGVKGDTPPY
jgi:hypothetical protein